MIGTRLGPYEITAKLGEGGMGEVYRATDTRLRRDVAIKVLPAAFSEDKERLVRFEREAQLLAQLHHPNIASIFGLEESEGVRALVMELVDGPTLAERLEQGPFPLNESLSVALRIAQALEEAHEKGIVHRDLKPQNIKASMEGTIKVLDFGLAKAMDPAGTASGVGSASRLAASPTLTLGATQMGMILGTAAYMAPEQAKGAAVDKRADIWAFGVVLFEMLSGKRLFEAPTVPETLAQVLTRTPDLEDLPAATPPSIRRLLRRCLERNPKNRLHDIADARLVIDDVLAGRGDAAASRVAEAATVASPRAPLPWVIAALALVVAAAALLWSRPGNRSASGAHQALHLELLPAHGERLPSLSSLQHNSFAISPDGAQLAYLVEEGATTEMRLRALGSDVSRAVPGTEGAKGLFFSPDGKWVGFVAGTRLEKVPLAGGAPIPIADAPDIRGAAWGDDGDIYFVPSSYLPVSRVPAAGGAVQVVTKIHTDEGELQHRWPEVVPGSKVLLYAVGYGGDWDDAAIVAERLDGGERKIVVKGGSAPRYLPTGQLVYARAGGLYAVGFDPRTLAVSGPPVEVARNVYRGTLGNAAMSVSRTGLLVTAPQDETGGGSVLSWIDREGQSERLPVAAGEYSDLALAPNDDRAAIGVGNSLAVLDLARLSLSRLTLTRRVEVPSWSLDGRRLYFGYEASAAGYALYSMPADDSGPPVLVAASGATEDPFRLARDGGHLLTLRFPTNGQNELLLRDVRDPKAEPRRILQSPYLKWSDADLSPDDRWVVYVSIESGRTEVYVRPTSGEERKWQVSVDGGSSPVWSRTGAEIFFLCGEKLLSAPVRAAGDGLVVGTPKVLFEGHRIVTYDATADGRRFLAAEDPNPGARTHLDVVVDWFAEVERKVAEARAP